jgi:pimeloyl-ACP methyl ester carboxylesterase
MRKMTGVLLGLGGAGLGLAFATWLARPRRRTPPETFAPAEEFVLADGVRTHVTRHGTAGPVVVLLHGMRGWFLTWRHVVPELAQHARVVLIDMKGFGLSTLPLQGEYNEEGLARHVLATLDALRIRRCVLGGLSLGGEIALRVALRAPGQVQGLILLGSTGYRRSNLMQWLLRLSPPFLQLAVARLSVRSRWAARLNLRRSFKRSERVTRSLVELYQKPTEVAGSEEAFLEMQGAPANPSATDRLAEIRMPTLLVWGDEDRITGSLAPRFRRDLPHAEFHLVPDAGHVTVEEQPERVARILVEWLGRTFPELEAEEEEPMSVAAPAPSPAVSARAG